YCRPFKIVYGTNWFKAVALMLCVLAGVLSVILLTDFLQDDAKESTAIPKVNILIFIENKFY
ncbi:MAG TPA: hypothetical protein VKA92_08830, partial [Segetibacter sp.]|nr:hypothetical protein [Segetibacter sp.]